MNHAAIIRVNIAFNQAALLHPIQNARDRRCFDFKKFSKLFGSQRLMLPQAVQHAVLGGGDSVGSQLPVEILKHRVLGGT